MSKYYLDDNFYDIWSIDQNFDGFIVDHVYKAIDKHQYRIISLMFPIEGDGLPYNKVH